MRNNSDGKINCDKKVIVTITITVKIDFDLKVLITGIITIIE